MKASGDSNDETVETGDGDGDWGEEGECQFMGYADSCPFEWADIPGLLPFDCGFDSPCGTLTFTYPFEPGDPIFDQTTYACVAQALRDGQPGRYTIRSVYADFGYQVLFDILPNRHVQRIGWAPDDVQGCGVRWFTRELLPPDYYQGCLDETDLVLAAECLESMWPEPFECVPLDQISCPG